MTAKEMFEKLGYVFDNKNEKLYFNLFTFKENRFYRREVVE